MFTRKKRHQKSDLAGVFRNIFTNNHTKDNVQSFQAPPMKDNKKASLRKKLKLPSFRVPGTLQRRKETPSLMLSPERHGFYNAITSPGPEFEEIDLSVSVSSILKNPNTERLSHKKRLRFLNESTLENSSLSDDVLKNNDSTVNDTVITQLDCTQSDVEYYTQMKLQMLERNKDVCYKKIKRSSSNRSNNKQKQQTSQNEDSWYFMESKEEVDTSKTMSLETSVDFKNRTYVICSNLHEPEPQAFFWTPENSFVCSNAIEVLPKPLCLQKWVSDNDVKNVDDFTQPNDHFKMRTNQSTLTGVNMSILFDSNDERFTYSELDQHDFRNKILPTKKYKKNRFDPIAKNETCSVAMLKNQRTSSTMMSWGSV